MLDWVLMVPSELTLSSWVGTGPQVPPLISVKVNK
jgi:hypothetical protein